MPDGHVYQAISAHNNSLVETPNICNAPFNPEKSKFLFKGGRGNFFSKTENL